MNYLGQFCQLKLIKLIVFIAVFSLGACSKAPLTYEAVKPVPVWFKVNERFTHLNDQGEPPAHPFFDLVPYPSSKENLLNFVVTTPAGSDFDYDLDLISGMNYKVFNYCEQKDIWKKYKDDIDKPTFTEGFIPRLLDQLGDPQRIMVFGREKFYKNLSPLDLLSHRVRVIGGVIEQFCHYYPCDEERKWKSKLLLVAVDPNDIAYKEVRTLNELKKLVDWDYFLAFIQNAKGRTLVSQTELPAYRSVGEVQANDAMVFAFKQGHYFKFSELKKMRQSCHVLYDYIWDNARKMRRFKTLIPPKKVEKVVDLPAGKKNDKENLNDFVNYSGNVWMSEQERIRIEHEKKLQEDRDAHPFSQFFKDFYPKYGKRFHTCTKFVRPSNINYDTERHWFFAFFTAFFKLDSMNQVYLCPQRSWVNNQRITSSKLLYDPIKEYSKCRTSELDRGFELAITKMVGLAGGGAEHYRYVTYDNAVGGSHHKLYSWVYFSGKTYNCTEKKKNLEDPSYAKNQIFPEDIQWRPFQKLGEGLRSTLIK